MSDDQRETDGTAGEADSGDESIPRCDYCRLPIAGERVTDDHNGIDYEFCCDACRDAVRSQEQVFTEYHGYRRLTTGVSALDASLPQGIPRNSFVILADLAGTRTEAVQAELVWRALQRGESVVYVTFLEPPVSVIQEFVTLEWNVLPSLENGDLRILDCFSYRVDDRERMHERMNAWNTHLSTVAEDATITVRDPSSTGRLQNRLDTALEEVGGQEHSAVVIDSLTELGSLVQPVQAYDFIKDIRADICKGRFVPIFAGATMSRDGEGFPHDLGYMVDGIVEMRLNEDIIKDALVKQLRVRKMNGVLTFPEWQIYEYTAGAGLVIFDPREEMADDQLAGETEPTDGDGHDETAATDGDETPEESADSDDTEREQSGGSTGADTEGEATGKE